MHSIAHDVFQALLRLGSFPEDVQSGFVKHLPSILAIIDRCIHRAAANAAPATPRVDAAGEQRDPGSAGVYYRSFISVTALVAGCPAGIKTYAEQTLIGNVRLPSEQLPVLWFVRLRDLLVVLLNSVCRGQVISPKGRFSSQLCKDVWAFLIRTIDAPSLERQIDILLLLISESCSAAALPSNRLQRYLANLLAQATLRSACPLRVLEHISPVAALRNCP